MTKKDIEDYDVAHAQEFDELTEEPAGEGRRIPVRGGGPDSKVVEEASEVETAKGDSPSAEAFAELKAERDQLVDRLARLLAEFDNARKRQEREKAEFRDYATGAVVEQFLPVVDNFALALNANASGEQLRTGVDLIVKQMDEALRALQVQPVPTVGQQFDPRVHEALGTVERDDLPDQAVAEEIRRGYRIRERLLRPAMVRVVSNPKQTEA